MSLVTGDKNWPLVFFLAAQLKFWEVTPTWHMSKWRGDLPNINVCIIVFLSLESVCLNGCQLITEEAVDSLLYKHSKSLRVLELFGCVNIKPSAIEKIYTHCKGLTTLNIGQCYKVKTHTHTRTYIYIYVAAQLPILAHLKMGLAQLTIGSWVAHLKMGLAQLTMTPSPS